MLEKLRMMKGWRWSYWIEDKPLNLMIIVDQDILLNIINHHYMFLIFENHENNNISSTHDETSCLVNGFCLFISTALFQLCVRRLKHKMNVIISHISVHKELNPFYKSHGSLLLSPIGFRMESIDFYHGIRAGRQLWAKFNWPSSISGLKPKKMTDPARPAQGLSNGG